MNHRTTDQHSQISHVQGLKWHHHKADPSMPRGPWQTPSGPTAASHSARRLRVAIQGSDHHIPHFAVCLSLSLDHSSKTGPKDNYAKGIWFHHTQSCRVCLPLVFVVVVVVFASRLSALAKLLGQWRVRDDSSHQDGKWTPVGLDRCQLLDWVDVCKVF